MITILPDSPANAGQWITLTASKQLEAPQLRISFSFGDPRIQMLSGTSAPSSRRSSTAAAGNAGNSNSNSLRPSRAPSRRVSITAAPAPDSSNACEQEAQDAGLLPQHADGSSLTMDDATAELAASRTAAEQPNAPAREDSASLPLDGSLSGPSAQQQREAAETSNPFSTQQESAPAALAATALEASKSDDATVAASSSMAAGPQSASQTTVHGGLSSNVLSQQQLTSTSNKSTMADHHPQQQQEEHQQQVQQQQQWHGPSTSDGAGGSDGVQDALQLQHPSSTGRPLADSHTAPAAAEDVVSERAAEEHGGCFASDQKGSTAGASTSGLNAAVTPERAYKEPSLEATMSPELASVSALVQGMH